MPGIEVCAEHDQFLRFVGTWNFRDDVEGVLVLVIKLVFNIHLEADRNFLLQHPRDTAVMFDRHYYLCWRRRIRCIPAPAALHEHCSSAARTRLDCGDYPFLDAKPPPDP